MNKGYYEIACNDLRYLQGTLHLPYYNNLAVNAQQVAEKMLKSVAESYLQKESRAFSSHNLRVIYNEINKEDSGIFLDVRDLAFLSDFYFSARYPGDNYMEADEETCNMCLGIMNDIISEVAKFREAHGMLAEHFEKLLIQNEEVSKGPDISF